MASNNPYGLPPLTQMVNNGAPPSHQYLYSQPQQHQSERISGDGEEVYRQGYLRPTGQGPPLQAVPPLGSLPPPPVTGYNYEGYNLMPNNMPNNTQYDQYEYAIPQTIPPQQQQSGLQLQQQNGIVEDDRIYSNVTDNRSIEGQEYRPVNEPPPPSAILENPSIAPQIFPGGGAIVNNPPPPVQLIESYQPVGLEMPPSFQAPQQEQRSETIGSAESHILPLLPMVPQNPPENDYRYGGGSVEYPSINQSEIDPRSIEGQEYPENEVESTNPSLSSSSNVYSSISTAISSNQEFRSQTIGSETQGEENPRSIEGQEQIPNDTLAGGIIIPPPVSTIPSAPPILLSSTHHHRSQTLGSDTMIDDSKVLVQTSKNSGRKSQNPASESETGESIGKSSRDVGDRLRTDPETRRSVRGKRDDKYDSKSSRNHRYQSYEDEDDSYEEDDRERRRDRDWDKDRKMRPKERGPERRRNDSRRENDWESSSTRPYYRNDEDDHYRPHSRNSSYHDRDEYRDSRRYRDRDSRRARNSRPVADEYSQYPSYGYGAPPTRYNMPRYPEQYPQAPVVQKSRQQMYLEKFRVENPTLYREWYFKYQTYLKNPLKIPCPPIPGFSAQGDTTLHNESKTGERLSQNSVVGQHSVADEVLTSEQDDAMFRPIQEHREPTPPQRLTPQKFLSSHSIAVLTPLGHMVRVRNGGSIVEIVNIKPMMKRFPEYKEVKLFPGPLIKDITHKNTIVNFCQRKIRELEINDAQFDRENLVLLWELLILLLRQNGAAIGSDIAELLLKSNSTGRSLSTSSSDGRSIEEELDNQNSMVNHLGTDLEQKCIEQFCEKLLYGHKKEALDYAMDNGLWGHALFFASKMGERTYGNVLARFANGMALNSPLQTLYQVLSGKQPASVTCCCDEAFGDWKPHLAMILSNAGQRPEVEGKAITTLGDTLGNRHHTFAAQFCYLMAEMEFSPDSKIGTLLGFIQSENNIIEATQMTEIYEFARTLGNPDFSLGTSFIKSKLEYTKTLLDLGFIQEAYSYCEEMTKSLRKGRIHENEQNVAWSILQIAERLINCDDSGSFGEPAWIEELRKITESESASRKLSTATTTESDNIINYETNQANQFPVPMYSVPSQNLNTIPVHTTDSAHGYPESIPTWNSNQQQTNVESIATPPSFDIPNNPPVSDPFFSQPLQNYGPPSINHDSGFNNNYLPPGINDYDMNSGSGGKPNLGSTYQPVKTEYEPPSSREDAKPNQRPANNNKKPSNNDKMSLGNGGKGAEGGSWFSGIFGKLSLKPKNQMILPDDKEQSIRWNPDKNRWESVNGEEEEDSAPKGPPPKDSDLYGNHNGSNLQNVPAPIMTAPANSEQTRFGNQLPPGPQNTTTPSLNMNGDIGKSTGPPTVANLANKNKYQRPKGISPRNNYVDVFNPNSTQRKNSEPKVPLPQNGPAMPNIFMPPPSSTVSDSGPTSFLTSTAQQFSEGNGEEVPQAPPMFDPSQFQNQNINNYGLNR